MKVLEQNKNINDFLCETQKDLKYAQEIFYSNNFLNDYSITDERIIKLYNRIVSDTDRENALNNFLVMTKLKNPPKIIFNKKRIEIKLKYFEDRKIRYKIPVVVEGSGNLDLLAQAKYPVEWLEIKNNEFINQKVIDGQLFEIFCIIDTKLITSSKVYNVIDLKTPYNTVEVELLVSREKAVKAELSKSSYISHEKGFLKVYNNTGEDLMIEILSNQNWLRFMSRKFYIPSYVEIPFEININESFFSAVPEYEAVIKLRTLVKDKAINEQIKVRALNN